MSQRGRTAPARRLLTCRRARASGREPAFKSPLYISKRHTERERRGGREQSAYWHSWTTRQAGGQAGRLRCCGAAQVGRQCGGGGRRSWQSLTVCSVSTTIPPEGGREALAADSLRRVADGAERGRERENASRAKCCQAAEGGREGGRKVCGELQ